MSARAPPYTRLDYTMKIRTRQEVKNIDGYYEKVVITNHVIEITRYEKLNTKGGGKREGKGEYKEQNYKQTQKNRRTSIRHLVTQNFFKSDKFVTLTFRDSPGFDIKDVKQCNEAFKAFIRRLKRLYPNLKYIAVIEFQDKNDRGAVHYHMICNLPYIEKDQLAQIWGYGFIKINAIDKVDNLGAYVVKYMNKDIDDVRLQGLKAYNCSKGLQKPVELKSWSNRDRDCIQDLKESLQKASPSYATTYESENAGHIEFEQYNLQRDNITGDNNGQ